MISLRLMERGVVWLDSKELKYVSKNILVFAVSSTVVMVGVGQLHGGKTRSCSIAVSAIEASGLSGVTSSPFPRDRERVEATLDSSEVLPVDRFPAETLALL